MKTKKAFTLIELMVAMGIIAVLATMSIVAIRIVQQNVRNTQRRDALNSINLSVSSFQIDYGRYPVLGTELIFNPNDVQLRYGGVTINTIQLSGPAAKGTGNDKSAYCYTTTGGYGLGVQLEGGKWHQLGEVACTTALP